MSNSKLIHIISYSDGKGGSELNAIKVMTLLNQPFIWTAIKKSPRSIEKNIRETPGFKSLNYLNHLTEKDSLLYLFLALKKRCQSNTSKQIYAIGFLPSLFAAILKVIGIVKNLTTTRREMMPWKKWYHKPFLIFINLMSTKIETNSLYIQNQLKNELFTKNKIYYIPNIVPNIIIEPPYQSDTFEVLKSFKCNIGLVANIREAKNIPLFFNIAKDIIKSSPTICFSLVGQDSPNNAAKNQIAKIQSKQIKFFNNINFNDIGNFYKNINIFLLTSTHEGSPNVIIEALAHGLPIVCSDIPATACMLKHKTNALLCKSNDKNAFVETIHTLISSTSLQKKMKANNTQYFRSHFDSKKTLTLLKHSF